MNKVDQSVHKLAPTHEDKILFIQTMAGAAFIMMDFIHKHKDFLQIPEMVLYQMMLTIANVDAMVHKFKNDKAIFGVQDVTAEPDVVKKLIESFRCVETSFKERGLI